ncbi:MAG: DUF1028 domain-containing protein, partial [Anaerolineae bacterium]
AAVVSWAQAKAGAVATQAWANASYGPEGLRLLQQGFSAEEVVKRLIEADEGRGHRQVGVVDSQGGAFAFTGSECLPWAGHMVGEGYTCQGNILVGEETLGAMAKAFEETEGELADRLVASLLAGQEAGGDSRGQQSAGLLVVREKGGYGGFSDRSVDLRVDDHPSPILELKRLLELHKLYFGETDPAKLVKIEGPVVRELQEIVKQAGQHDGPLSGVYNEATKAALQRLVGIENLEERWREDEYIDEVVLEFLREKFGG